MRSASSVIDLSRYLHQTPPASAARGSGSDLRLRRRCMRVLAAVEAAVTVCIGAGFLVCLGLVFSML